MDFERSHTSLATPPGWFPGVGTPTNPIPGRARRSAALSIVKPCSTGRSCAWTPQADRSFTISCGVVVIRYSTRSTCCGWTGSPRTTAHRTETNPTLPGAGAMPVCVVRGPYRGVRCGVFPARLPARPGGSRRELAHGTYGERWYKIRNPAYSQYEGRRELFERRRAVGVGT
jgi:hypothetical protein